MAIDLASGRPVPDEPRTGIEPAVIAPLFATVAVGAIGNGMILPLLPFYSLRFGATPFVIGLLLASFSLCQFVAAPVFGRASDRFGRRNLLVASQAGTLAGFVMLALAPSLPWVFAARMIDGLRAGNIAVAIAFAVDLSAPAARRQAIGIVSAAFGLGTRSKRSSRCPG